MDNGYARCGDRGACDLALIIGELIVLNVIFGVNSENMSLIYIAGGPNSNDYGIIKILHHTIEWLDLSQELRRVQTVNCGYQVVVLSLGIVISLGKKNRSFLSLSPTPKLKETKGGMMIDAHRVFNDLPRKTIASWNFIITSCALHGYNEEDGEETTSNKWEIFDDETASSNKKSPSSTSNLFKAIMFAPSLTINKALAKWLDKRKDINKAKILVVIFNLQIWDDIAVL